MVDLHRFAWVRVKRWSDTNHEKAGEKCQRPGGGRSHQARGKLVEKQGSAYRERSVVFTVVHRCPRMPNYSGVGVVVCSPRFINGRVGWCRSWCHC
jgi:hypothetical protein